MREKTTSINEDAGTLEVVTIAVPKLTELIEGAMARVLDAREAVHAEQRRDEEVISIREAASMLQRHDSTVRRYIRLGRLVASRATPRGSSAFLITRSSVLALLKTGRE